VAEPQCNDSKVNACLEHVHCGRVPDYVGGDATPLELWTLCCGRRDSELETICHTRSSHWSTGTTWEERLIECARGRGDAGVIGSRVLYARRKPPTIRFNGGVSDW
jgi:hypothetical protein